MTLIQPSSDIHRICHSTLCHNDCGWSRAGMPSYPFYSVSTNDSNSPTTAAKSSTKQLRFTLVRKHGSLFRIQFLDCRRTSWFRRTLQTKAYWTPGPNQKACPNRTSLVILQLSFATERYFRLNSILRRPNCCWSRWTMLLCIWLTRLSLRSRVDPISFIVNSS